MVDLPTLVLARPVYVSGKQSNANTTTTGAALKAAAMLDFLTVFEGIGLDQFLRSTVTWAGSGGLLILA